VTAFTAPTAEVEIAGNALRGMAVHITSRIGALAAPGEVLVSSTVKDLVAGSGFTFVDRGAHELKGVPAAKQIYGVGMNVPSTAGTRADDV
jgi:class 3 adenylate cyclase